MNDENKEFKKAVFESDEQTKGKEEAREEMAEDIVEEIREEQALPPGFTREDPPLRFVARVAELEEEVKRLRKANSSLCETIARLESRVAAWRRLAEDLERMRTPVIHHTQEKQFK